MRGEKGALGKTAKLVNEGVGCGAGGGGRERERERKVT